MPANLHTHTEFCDAKVSALAMAEAARAAGFDLLGFSSHAPLPFATEWTMDADRVDEYVAAIRSLATRFAPAMTVMVGLEIDYIEGLCGPADGRFAGKGLEYSIGSVHHVAPPRLGPEPLATVDGPQEAFDALIGQGYGGDPSAMVDDYFAAVAACVRAGGFDILGHLDLIRKNNPAQSRFREDTGHYRDAAMSVVDALAGSGVIVEINTGGMARGKTDSPYPAGWLLSELKARGVEACVNADAHETSHLTAYRDAGLAAAAAAGYERLTLPTPKGRAYLPLE